ncbi:MAG: hypothetical protein AB7F35_03415 [Acetobacteraceae bacterium]
MRSRPLPPLHVFRSAAVGGLVSLGTALGVAGCDNLPAGFGSGAPPATASEARADAATLEACRRRADEVYARQNRGDIYTPYANMNAPWSGAYAGGGTRGLSTQFTYEQAVQNCVRNVGAAALQTGTPAGSPSPAVTPPSQGERAPPPPSMR